MVSHPRMSAYVTFALVIVTVMCCVPQSSAKTLSPIQDIPECWTLEDEIAFDDVVPKDSLLAVQRVSTYELHDDDTVNPNHLLTELPYFSSLTWNGSADVEWLVLEGNFSYYTIDPVAHSVTFYSLQGWLHVVYRTHRFIRRTPNEIEFCVNGTNSQPWPTRVRVLYPANYQLRTAQPTGFSIPAPGEIAWNFGTTSEFQVRTIFAGLGPDRPLLDFPVDYQGRVAGSITGFTAAFSRRVTSKFDHKYPNYTHDNKFLPYTGEEYDDPPSVNCTYGRNCYDGHDAYDIGHVCPDQAPCTDAYAVFAAASGSVVASQTGWNAILGCRITIDHGNQWKTVYAHLQDIQNNHTCSGILRWSGTVERTTKIGIMGGTGSGGGGAANAHLHFQVFHNGITVDPSGWDPNPQVNPDPWSQHQSGSASYPMWMHSIRTTQALDPSNGGEIASPTHEVRAIIPTGFYNQQLMFSLSDDPVAGASAQLVNTGHSFSLTARNQSGNLIHQLNRSIALVVDFDTNDVRGIKPETLAIYFWNTTSDLWEAVPTSIDWNATKATAQVNHLSVFALLGQLQNSIFVPVIRVDR